MKELTGMRIAGSTLFGAPSTKTAEIDFGLGHDMALAIYGVLGQLRIIPTFGAALVEPTAQQTLHLETGALEVGLIGVADVVRPDTEIIFEQFESGAFAFTAAGTFADFQTGQPLFLKYPEPILTARNLTHRVISVTEVGIGNVYIYYKIVELTQAELVVALARRY